MPIAPATPPVGRTPTAEIVINVGELPPEVPYDRRETSDAGKSVLLDYRIDSRYLKSPNIHMLPVASPNGFNGSSVAFVQLAAPMLLWVCDWTVFKCGALPEAPNPLSLNPDWVLLRDHWEPASIELSPDGGTPRYRLSGTYVYGHRNPRERTYENVTYPMPPWIEDKFARTISSENLADGLSEPSGGLHAANLGPIVP